MNTTEKTITTRVLYATDTIKKVNLAKNLIKCIEQLNKIEVKTNILEHEDFLALHGTSMVDIHLTFTLKHNVLSRNKKSDILDYITKHISDIFRLLFLSSVVSVRTSEKYRRRLLDFLFI